MSGIVGTNAGRSSGKVGTVAVGADAITGDEIADDVIDSEHYVAASIDNEHLADGAAGTDEIADNAVTLAKMAGGTDGNLISYDTSGNPVAVAAGNDGQVLTSAGAGAVCLFEDAAGGGKIGQVISVTKTDTFSSASATWVDLTGMTVSITPAATSSKILVLITLGSFQTSGNDSRSQGKLLRGTTAIADGDAATGQECTWAQCGRTTSGTNTQFSAAASFLDAPSSTSSTTYKLQVQRGPDADGSVYVNRAGTQDANSGNAVSTITVMEVLA